MSNSTNVGAVYIDLGLNTSELKRGFAFLSKSIRGLEGEFSSLQRVIDNSFSAKRFGGFFNTFGRMADSVSPVVSEVLVLNDAVGGTVGILPDFGRAMANVLKPNRAFLRSLSDTYGSVADLNEELPKIGIELGGMTEKSGVFGKKFGKVIEDSLSDAVRLDDGFGKATESIKTSWEKMLVSMETGWGSAWNSITSTLSGALNRAVTGINGLISGLNNININIPASLNGGQATNFRFSVPKMQPIPELATGGIVQAPTIALVGEAGREAVLPLERNTGWMNELALVLAPLINANSNGGQTARVDLHLDGRKVAEGIIDDLVSVARRRDLEL